jgi:membrane dipeptidase
MPHRTLLVELTGAGASREKTVMNRREVLKAGGALGVMLGFSRQSFGVEPVYLADMHYHLFFGGPYNPRAYPLGPALADGPATLVAWSLVSDGPWMGDSAHRYRQKQIPAPGDSYAWFNREITRIKAHVADQKLKIIRTSADVEAAVKGDPHIVLATEGSFFLEDDLSRLSAAYDQGVRHVQLVHYLKNSVGDYQTEQPTYDGLTEFGKQVVRECNRLGILIDLAHCTEQAVTQALAISKAPMIWSHSSIVKPGNPVPEWSMMLWKARQLTLPMAKRIAKNGGVVGLWAFAPDVGSSAASYALRLAEMADQLGEDHVGFGTDLHGLGDTKNQAVSDYGELRNVVAHWQKTGMNDNRIRKIAIQNYARALKEAFRLRAA